MIREECGVVGISLKNSLDVSRHLYYALYALQHRGQESAGMAVFGRSGIKLYKEMGLVSETFNKKLGELNGSAGIGHVRYSTTGESKIENSQPFFVNYKDETFAIAHNGNLVNYREMKSELERRGRVFTSTSDSEAMLRLLVEEIDERRIHKPEQRFLSAIFSMMGKMKGSYSAVLLSDGYVIAFRDPLGIKPLCIGEIDGGYIIASESVAIDTLNGKFIRDLKPGEAIILKDGEIINEERLIELKNTAHCMFEYVYFARPDSIVDGRSVYDVRMRIGEILAEKSNIDADIVSPTPDSGVTFAIGYAKRSGLPYIESLMKNRYVGRTFIMPSQDVRELSVHLKLNPIKANIEGKRIVLVDDSVVRGTTSKRIVEMLRRSGAKEIHLCVGCPPLISPCYFGVDFTTRDELIASKRSIEELSKIMGVDSLHYTSIEDLIRAIGKKREDLCMACLTGEYRVKVPGI
jgi:amidophosphoribosyltransferase